MTQEVQLEKEIVILDSDIIYSGKEEPAEEEKLVRKAVGLPVKKQLIYYTDTHDANSVVNVEKYQLIEMYNINDRWYTIEVIFADDTKARIHSRFLAEMQKPSFISDMEAQMA